MKRNKRLHSKEAGSVMAMTLIAVLLLAITGTGLLSLGLHGRTRTIRTVADISSRCAADAGMSKAVFEMNEKLKIKPWNDSNLPSTTNEALPNCNAIFSYAVTVNASSVYNVESTGYFGLSSKRITSILRLKGLFEHAILSRGDLILKSGTSITGYDSGDPNIVNAKASIATTSTSADSIILNNGVTVNGGVYVGVDGDTSVAIKDLGATTDSTHSLTEEPEFPMPVAPTMSDKGSITVQNATLTIGPSDSGNYSSITLKNSASPAVLEAAGGDVVLNVTGDISLGQSCEIVIKSGATLTIYLAGDLDTANDSGFNNETCDPKDFKLYGTGTNQSWDIKAKSDAFGAIYAPNADIDVYANGDVYGSIVADDFEFKSGGDFYYDQALKEVTTEDEQVLFVIERWSE